MESYKVFVKASAQKEIRALPTAKARRAVVARIASLATDPRPRGCVRLTGSEKYRLRQGPYRILYTVSDERVTVSVVRVAHRKVVYR